MFRSDSYSQHKLRTYAWRAAPYLLVACLALNNFLYEVPRSQYRVDETGWTWASAGVARLLAAGDFRPSQWQGEEDFSYGSINPPLGKMLFAIPILAGCAPVDTHMPPKRVYIDLTKSLGENKELGAVIPDEILHPLRRVSAVLGAALCLVCMAMVHQARGPLAAFIAGVALAYNPLLANVASSVLTDISYQLFLFAGGLAAMGLGGVKDARTCYRQATLTGLLGGLSTACKYSAPFFLLPYALLMLVLLRLTRRASGLQMYAAAALLAASLVAVVYVTNPMLWPDPARISREGIINDYRLWRYGELHLQQGGEHPYWTTILRTRYEPQATTNDGDVLQLTPPSHENFRDVFFNIALATAECNEPSLRPQTMLPNLFALLRPLQLPWIYLRWVYFKEWVECDPLWLHSNPYRFLRYATYKHLAYASEYRMALLGALVLLLPLDGRHRYWLAPSRALLFFAAIYITVLYATKVNDLDRYLVGMIMLRSMLGAIALHFVLQLAWKSLRRLTASRVHP